MRKKLKGRLSMQKIKRLRRQTFIKAVTLCIASAVLMSANTALGENPMQITTSKNTVSFHTGDNLLLRYCYNNVPFKPYVQQLYSPKGINILRDAPYDHLHHHGLMFAIAVDGINFWEEKPELVGKQRHISFCNVTVDKNNDVPQAGFAELIDWENSQSGQLLLKEQRIITISQPKDINCTLLTWQSILQTPPDKKSVLLTGKRYFGLGMRFVESMDKDGNFVNADGKTSIKGTNNVQSSWCAYTAKADGQAVTAAMFNEPENQPCKFVWFTMDKPFAYLALTMNLHNEPLKLTCSKPLTLNYAVALWDGKIDTSQIEKVYKLWIDRQG
jgi:hypothetical protein